MDENSYSLFCEFIHDVLYDKMSIDDYYLIFDTFNVPYKKNKDGCLLKTFCHNSDLSSAKYNLVFYEENRSFFCFSECGCSYNIITLMEKSFKTNGQNMSRFNCVKNICEICSIPFNFADESKPIKQIEYNWKKTLGKYDKGIVKEDEESIIYDNKILNFFEEKYHSDWIDYGITIDTMKKYGIKWYGYRSQIVLPCYDYYENLIGIRIRNMNTESDIRYMPLKLLNGDEYRFKTSLHMFGENHNFDEIRRTKTVWIVESEKSVLKFDSWFGERNVSVAMFGSNLSEQNKLKLLKLGINSVVIMIDSDFIEVGDEHFAKFEKKVMNIYNEFKPYVDNIYCVYNNQGYDGYKFSPCDFTREQFDILMENKERIE